MFRRHAPILPLLFLLLPLVCGSSKAEEPSAGEVYPEQPVWFKDSFLDLREDVAEAAAEGKRVMLYFHQEGCPYCARLLRQNFGDPDIAARTQALYDVIALNLWGDREVVDSQSNTTSEKRLAEALKVQYTPTLLVLDEAGQPGLRINGYYHKERFARALEYGAGRGGDAAELRRSGGGETADEKALQVEPYFRQPPFDLTQPHDKPLLVLFEQEDCAPCTELHEKGLRDPANRELIQRFDVVQLDAEADTPVTTPTGERLTARAWADALGIKYLPSLIFFDTTGAEVFRIEAFLWSFHLQSALDYVASGAYQGQPSFQRFLRERREQLQKQGKDVRLVD